MKQFFILLMAGLSLPVSLLAQNFRSGHDWTVQSSGHSQTMSLVVQVQIDGTLDADAEIGAFCGEECRGKAVSSYLSEAEKYLWYLTVYGSTNGDALDFFVRKQGVELDAETNYTTTFTINGAIGTLIQPQVIDFAPHHYLLVTDPSQLVTGRNYLFSTSKVLDVTQAIAVSLDTWNIEVDATGGASLSNKTTEATLTGFLFVQCEYLSGTHASLNITDATALYVVPSGSTLTVNALSTVGVSNLIVEDGAQLVNASAGVLATLQKNIAAYTDVNAKTDYYTIAAPLTSTAVASNSNLTTFEYDLYEFDETNLIHEEWRNYKYQGNFVNFTPGKGYLYANDHNVTLNLFGTMNVSNTIIPLTYTNARVDEFKGFNLIGNPYPHVIYKGKGAAIDDSRLADGYYLLSCDGAWQAKTYTDPIQPGTGILVMASEAGDLTIVKTSAAATAESDNNRDQEADGGQLSVRVGTGASEDVAYLYGRRNGHNLRKLSHLNPRVPELSFCCDRERYAIACCDGSETTLDLRFDNRMAGSYTLTWDVAEWLGEHPYLVDNFTGAHIDMLTMTEYTFTAIGNEHPFRFKMVLSDAFMEDGGNVCSNLPGEGTVQIFDLTGRLVISHENVSSVSTQGMTPGVYIIRWTDGNRVETQKIVVQ